MKNKGRRHLAGNGSFWGAGNCKGALMTLTRPVTQMGSRRFAKQTPYKKGTEFDLIAVGYSASFDKRKWSKRVRQYFRKWNTEELLEID